MPAFSIGKSEREPKSNQQVPGPGTYNPLNKFNKRLPTWKIGSSERTSIKPKQEPGVGQYDVNKKNIDNIPKYSMGCKNYKLQTDKMNSLVPGPGTYDSKLIDKAPIPQITFAGKYDNMIERPGSEIGPGKYELTTSNDKNKQIRFTKSHRGSYSISHTPGPGNYNIAGDLVKKSTAGGFFTSTRQDLVGFKSDVGPGQYEVSVKGSEKQYTFGLKNKEFGSKMSVPGPGSYNIVTKSKFGSTNAKSGMGTSTRSSKIYNYVPGPGQYNLSFVNRPFSAQYKIGIKNNNQNSIRNQDFPGPGQYDIHNINDKGTSVFISNRNAAKKDKSDFPGPGEYEIQHKRPGTSHVIGTSGRNNQDKNVVAIGPGQYNSYDQKVGPSYQFGTEVRRKNDKKDKEPGPGSYDLPSYFGVIPAYAQNQLDRDIKI